MNKLRNSVCLVLFLFVFLHNSFAQTKTITGTISNSKGNALRGAVITINKTSVTTNAQGKFIVEIPANSKIFTVSYTGMLSREIVINKRPFYIIELKPDTAQSKDVVAIGYGTISKKNITSAISSVTESYIKNIPVAGVDNMLQGKVAGVTITSNSGQPGGDVNILVRGITTVNNNSPLYVIDGMPVHTNITGGGQDYLGGVNGQTQQSILATINPSDIASIDILKDASAQAIYGADGGNGVILITTKHGSTNTNKLEYNVYYGLQQLQHKLPVMNLKQYAEYYNSALNDPNSGVTDTISEFKNIDVLGTGTDWQDAIFKTGYIQNHQLSFSGGQNKNTYYFSANYFDQKGILINTGFKRYALRGGFDQQINSWLKAGFSTNLSSSDEQVSVTDGEQSVIEASLYNNPVTPIKDLDGNYINSIPVQDVAFGNAQNPVALGKLRNVQAKQSKAFGNIYAEVQLTKSLNFKSQFSYDYQFNDNSAFQPYVVNPDGTIILSPGKLRVDKGNSLYYNIQNYFTYNHSFGKHILNIIAGQESWLNHYENTQVSVINLTNNMQSLDAGTPDPASPANGGNYETASESYFARINYSYNNRYLLSLSGRADGRSDFGLNKRWGYFPAASVGWIITNENFTGINKIFSFLKIRLGAGAAGVSQSLINNAYSTNIRLVYGATGLFGSPAVPSMITNVGNPDLQWEDVLTYNGGIDATIAKRVDVSVDVYKKVTTNMILSTAFPGFAGLDPNPTNNGSQEIEPPFINAGRMTNSGFDVSITSYNIKTRNVTWNTTLIFSHYKNVLNKLYAPEIIIYGKSQSFAPVTLTETTAGIPVGSFYGYVTDGLYRSQDEVAKGLDQGLPIDAHGLWAGDIRYKDLNGDGKITDADQTFIGNPNPKFTCGLTNTFSFKSFDLSIFLQGVYGNKIFNYSRSETEAEFNIYQNQLTTVLNRFTAENTNTTMPRYNQFNQNNTKISDRYIEDGSFLRIQNVSLGYNFPSACINHLKMSSCKIYIAGQNLYTFTKYSGYDPEIGAFNGNVTQQNIDYGHYPNPRSITIGADIVF